MNKVPLMFMDDLASIITEEDIKWIQEDAEEIASKNGKTLMHLTVFLDKDEEGEFLAYKAHYLSNIKRVRRITGYFSEVTNFNPAKQAELADRVPHAKL